MNRVNNNAKQHWLQSLKWSVYTLCHGRRDEFGEEGQSSVLLLHSWNQTATPEWIHTAVSNMLSPLWTFFTVLEENNMSVICKMCPAGFQMRGKVQTICLIFNSGEHKLQVSINYRLWTSFLAQKCDASRYLVCISHDKIKLIILYWYWLKKIILVHL